MSAPPGIREHGCGLDGNEVPGRADGFRLDPGRDQERVDLDAVDAEWGQHGPQGGLAEPGLTAGPRRSRSRLSVVAKARPTAAPGGAGASARSAARRRGTARTRDD